MTLEEKIPGYSSDLNTFTDGAVVVPDNNADLPKAARAIYVGVTGDVKILNLREEAEIFRTVPVGILYVQIRRVFATGTTAANMIALF